MNQATAARLLDLNHQFYQTFARQFSSTRARLQPGVAQLLRELPATSRILDLGCGNGVLAAELRRLGHVGEYIGLDFSPQMLELARQRCQQLPQTHFLFAELGQADWGGVFAGETASLLKPASFDFVLAFAVMHHLPGETLRQELLQHVHRLLQPHGRFMHSEWQFLNSPSLRNRTVSWSAIGLNDGDVEAGDYLLDWRGGGLGLRYVHLFSEDELAALAARCGFSILSTFYSDGHTRNLALYQIWQPKG